MEVLECMVVKQAITLLEGLIPRKDDKDGGGASPEHLEKLYVFAIMWSIGALLELEDRSKLEEFMRTSDEVEINLPEIPPDSEDTMFDFFVHSDGKIDCFLSSP